MDDLQCLLEPADKVIEGIAECPELVLVIPGSQTKDQSPSADLIDCISHRGQQCRITKARAGDKRAELNACRNCRQRCE
jgi:hypothetical protein